MLWTIRNLPQAAKEAGTLVRAAEGMEEEETRKGEDENEERGRGRERHVWFMHARDVDAWTVARWFIV
jgi:hypothetical protein